VVGESIFPDGLELYSDQVSSQLCQPVCVCVCVCVCLCVCVCVCLCVCLCDERGGSHFRPRSNFLILSRIKPIMSVQETVLVVVQKFNTRGLATIKLISFLCMVHRKKHKKNNTNSSFKTSNIKISLFPF